MKECKKLQPKLAELKEKYKNDQAKNRSGNNGSYRSPHKVNPLSGCLPILIQILFLSAYKQYTPYAIELRHSHFSGGFRIYRPKTLITLRRLSWEHHNLSNRK